MLKLAIVSRPTDDQFARVDRVKHAVGHVILPGDEKYWILGEPLVLEVHDGETITVPAGFTTDGASIPLPIQLATSWKPFEGPQRWAGITHDWLYYQDGYKRSRADLMFKYILRAEYASCFQQNSMYAVCRCFSSMAYRRNQARNAEDRIWQ